MKCVKCNHDVNDEFKFCNFCGSAMIKEIRCKSCKALVPEGSKFCGLCGTPLKEVSLKETPLKPDTIKIPPTRPSLSLTGRLNGYDVANYSRAKGWVNEYNGWVYLFEKSSIEQILWKIKEDGSEGSRIYQGDGTCLNVNRHGVFFVQDADSVKDTKIVHLDFDGNKIEEFKLKNFSGKGIFVYDDRIYYGEQRPKQAIIQVSSCKIDGNDQEILAKVICNKKDKTADCEVKKISSDGKIVVFYVTDELKKATGWYRVDVTGQNLKKIEYIYEEVDDDGEKHKEFLPVFYIDVEQRLAYTGATDEERGQYKLGMMQGVIERSIDKAYDKLVKGKLAAPIYYKTVSPSENFRGFQNLDHSYFNGKVSYGFTYSHQGINKAYTNYTYNLYKLNEKGEATFLNAGSNQGSQDIMVAGQYIYFNRQTNFRVKLDGTEFMPMETWCKSYDLIE